MDPSSLALVSLAGRVAVEETGTTRFLPGSGRTSQSAST